MLRITALMDNTAGAEDLLTEHGLSFFIQYKDRSLLFDTGNGGAFIANARTLGIDLAGAEGVMVSHGHYDHGNGFRPFCDEIRPWAPLSPPLWTGPGFFDRKWSEDAQGSRYLGVDFDEAYLKDRQIEHRVVGETHSAPGAVEIQTLELLPGVHAVNGFPRLHGEELISTRFVADRDGGRRADDFRDESCLAIDLGGAVAVVLGCAHPGIMNMLDAVRAHFEKPLAAVFGGSHLVEADLDRIDRTVEYLCAADCSLVALGHCTGAQGAARLADALPSYRPLHVGAVYEL
jgi:7,8-dihydropterin-6-yl-methyl-4-(beta-D-ribofuranosyl)aminobenzene 5'-phosphate synthase